MVCFRDLDWSDVTARTHAHGGVLLSTGPQPLTQNRGKSEKQNFPITPGKKEERGEERREERRGEEEGAEKRQFRAWADGDAENGSAATLELSALTSPPAPIAISRARSLPPTLLLPLPRQGRSCRAFAILGDNEKMCGPFLSTDFLKDVCAS